MNVKTLPGAIALLLLLVPHRAAAQGARLELDHLKRLSDAAAETVDVSVDAAMLKEAAGLFAGKDADTARVQQLLQDIKGIYVRKFQFEAPGVYTESDVDQIRRQLERPGWTRVVNVRGKRETTEVYLWSERDTNGGLAVITAEPNELTVVNIVGRVDLASLAALGPIIPKLPGAGGTPAPK